MSSDRVPHCGICDFIRVFESIFARPFSTTISTVCTYFNNSLFINLKKPAEEAP